MRLTWRGVCGFSDAGDEDTVVRVHRGGVEFLARPAWGLARAAAGVLFVVAVVAFVALCLASVVAVVLGVAFALPWLASIHPMLALLVVLAMLLGAGAVAQDDPAVERLEAIHTTLLMRR